MNSMDEDWETIMKLQEHYAHKHYWTSPERIFPDVTKHSFEWFI